MDFNKLNLHLYQESAPHRFAKKPTEIDRGYLKIANWLGELCFYYEQKRKDQEKYDENEFLELIKSHREKLMKLEDSEFKKGLLKALSEL